MLELECHKLYAWLLLYYHSKDVRFELASGAWDEITGTIYCLPSEAAFKSVS